MTTRERTEEAAKTFVDNSYVKIGTMVAAMSMMASTVWVVAQASHRLETLEKKIDVAAWERWTRISQERWARDLMRDNPQLKVPDPRDDRYGFEIPGKLKQ